MESSVKTLAIKVYEEQLKNGWSKTCELIGDMNKDDVHVIAIRHDRDYNADDAFLPSIEKPHVHIIWRTTGRTPRKVRSVLNALGVFFRPDKDKKLWEEHGVETVGNFAKYALYLTHETPEAIADGKALYELDDLVSNLTREEIVQVRDGYIRLAEPEQRVGTRQMAELDEGAYRIGYDLKPFEEWYNALPFEERSHAKMRTVKESYERGVLSRVAQDDKVNRLCIFIQGEPNCGKTYAALKALSGRRILKVEGGGTGKFDRLSPATEAIVISDDDIKSNLLNMTDNYMCQVYRRQSNNPYWCGEYFIVTSNLDFFEWLYNCRVYRDEHQAALESRFYICHVYNGVLQCTEVSERGTKADQEERKKKFIDFRNKFNKCLESYVPEDEKVDYSDIKQQASFAKWHAMA